MDRFKSKYSALQKRGITDPAEYEQQLKLIKDAEDAQIEKLLTDVQKKMFMEMKRQGREGRLKPDDERRVPQP